MPGADMSRYVYIYDVLDKEKSSRECDMAGMETCGLCRIYEWEKGTEKARKDWSIHGVHP